MCKRILFVVTEDWYFCSHRLSLAKTAIEAGFDVAVATRVKSHGDVIEGAGITLIPLLNMNRSGKSPAGEWRSIAELVRVYRQFAPDIVHHVAMKPMLYGGIAARITKVEHVIQAISGFGFVFLSDTWKAKLLKIPIKILLRFSLCQRNTEVIVQNPDDAGLAKIIGVAEKHLHLIPGSGVNTKLFYPVPERKGTPIVTLVARMLWDKGVGEFVDAVRLLKGKGLMFEAQLVGEPDNCNPASIPLKQLQVWEKDGLVRYCGRMYDIQKVWAESHIAVLPSYREGLPKSLLEAAACGRAMVASDVPGCRSVVVHEKTGLLVKARDVDALAQAMQRLIEGRGLRERMGLTARKEVEERFSDTVINRQIISLYQTLSAP